MGNIYTNIMSRLFEKKECRIVMLGLAAAGKTTILYKLQLGECVNSLPTIGFNVETFEFKKLKLNMWDLGGQDKLIPMWKHYFSHQNGIIFVIDSSDKNSLEKVKTTLYKCLAQEELKEVPLLIFANKQDIGILSIKDIIEYFQLTDIKDRPWHIQGTSAITGDGLIEGMTWLHDKIAQLN